MYSDEKVKIKLPSGYNINMSIDAYDNHYCNFTESQFFSFSNFIHAGIYFPRLMQFIMVMVVIFKGNTGWNDILLSNIINGIAFTLMWYWCRTYKIPAISFIACLLGKYFFRFFLHYIVFAAVAFFVIKDWKVLLFCAIGEIITSIIKTLMSSFLESVKYNDEVVRYVSGFKYKQ